MNTFPMAVVAQVAHGDTKAHGSRRSPWWHKSPSFQSPFPASPPNNQKCLAKFKKLNREQTLQHNDGRDLFHGIAFCSVEALYKPWNGSFDHIYILVGWIEIFMAFSI